MSIQYLNTSTQMKIRPVSDKDVIFKMETNEFMTTCCRVNTSYDLVVRDITSGAMLFCISGAEIEDHPLEVYINDNHHIGRIEGINIHVHGESNQTVRIQQHKTQYRIQQCTVATTAGLVTLNWSTDFSVELKALSIAFALNIAMTKHKSTVIDGAVIRSTTPVDVRYPSLLPSTQSEACPRNNRLIVSSTFTSQSGDQEFWLKVAGRQQVIQANTMFLVSEENQKVVGRINGKNGDAEYSTVVKALDIDGTELFTTTWINAVELKPLSTQVAHLKSCGQEIGSFTFNFATKEYELNFNEGNSMKRIFTRSAKKSGASYKTFLDSNNKEYGEINNYFSTAFHIKFAAGVSSTIKKLIIGVSYFHFGHWMQTFKRLPMIRLSRLTCNCGYCEKPLLGKLTRANLFPYAYTAPILRIKPAGHNKQKNLIYFDVYRDEGGLISCTLEVTPIKNFRGVAKIEGRNVCGLLLFTSLHDKNNDVLTIYGQNGQLLAYIVKDRIYDNDQMRILKLNKSGKKTTFDEERSGPNVKFFINDFREGAVSSIAPYHFTLKLYRYRLPGEKPSKLHIYVELTLAAKLYSDPYKFDKIPTPEICYCYQRPGNMKIKELE